MCKFVALNETLLCLYHEATCIERYISNVRLYVTNGGQLVTLILHLYGWNMKSWLKQSHLFSDLKVVSHAVMIVALYDRHS